MSYPSQVEKTNKKYKEIAMFYGYETEYDFYKSHYKSLNQICKMMDVSYVTAGRRIKLCGIPLNKRGGKNNIKKVKT
jgi:hypothetical protein